MSLPIHFVTIALDAQPLISWHYPIFRQLQVPWTWTVVEGVALPRLDTKWVTDLEPRLSLDGTHEYLTSLALFDSRVRLISKPGWLGKTAMFNEALEAHPVHSMLWQVDSDEIWTVAQIHTLYRMFVNNPNHNAGYFYCRYFVGPDIAIVRRDDFHFGNRASYEWHRVWIVEAGDRFECHEPPRICGLLEKAFKHDETERAGLVFDHFAWATEEQVAFKQRYYGSANNKNWRQYSGLIDGWHKLQANQDWPVQVNKYLPFVDPGVVAIRV